MKSAVPAEETTALQWMNSFAAQRTKYLRFAQVRIWRASGERNFEPLLGRHINSEQSCFVSYKIVQILKP
jgi:hypothetical protein